MTNRQPHGVHIPASGTDTCRLHAQVRPTRSVSSLCVVSAYSRSHRDSIIVTVSLPYLSHPLGSRPTALGLWLHQAQPVRPAHTSTSWLASDRGKCTSHLAQDRSHRWDNQVRKARSKGARIDDLMIPHHERDVGTKCKCRAVFPVENSEDHLCQLITRNPSATRWV